MLRHPGVGYGLPFETIVLLPPTGFFRANSSRISGTAFLSSSVTPTTHAQKV